MGRHANPRQLFLPHVGQGADDCHYLLPNRLFQPIAPGFWSRFAALLSFTAMLSALLAPVGLLAEGVRIGDQRHSR
jgi:hypothetical protein